MENTAHRAIAIVGVGAVLPDAPNVPAFWENIKNSRYSVSEVTARPLECRPLLRFRSQCPGQDLLHDWRLGARVSMGAYEVAHRRATAVVDAMDGAQKWAIACTREALEDYGYPKAAAESGSHGGDSRQCHGRRKTLLHCRCVCSFRSMLTSWPKLPASLPCPRRRAATSRRNCTIAWPHGPPRDYGRHHARRIGQLHCRSHCQYLQLSRSQLRGGRGLRLGDGGL